MRPYQLYQRGPWVDLDQVQEIELPRFVDRMGDGGYFVQLDIYFAFRDKPHSYVYESECEYVPTEDENFPKLDERGWPHRLHWLVAEVYVPLMSAWGNIVVLTHKDPVFYGYDEARYVRTRR